MTCVFGIGEQLRAALALLLEGQPAVILVDNLARPVEHGRVLVDRRQPGVGERGEHGRMDRMHMHDAARMRHVAVDGAVQSPGGRVGRVGAAQRLGVVGVDEQQVARLDAREMHLVRVHQEFRAVVVDGEREMVGHRFMHVEPGRPAEGAGEIDALLVEGQVGELAGLEACEGHGGLSVNGRMPEPAVTRQRQN